MVFAQRQQKAAQHLLSKAVQHIGLVARIAFGAANAPHTLLILLNTRIVPGGDLVAPQHIRAVKQLVELHIAVAVDAGVWRAPRKIACNKLVDDLLAKVVREVEDKIVHAEAVRHAARVLHIVKRAAGVRAVNARIGVVVELHRAADAEITCVAQ